MRAFEIRGSVRREVSVAKIIDDNDEDIGFLGVSENEACEKNEDASNHGRSMEMPF